MKIIIGSDHGGFALKGLLTEWLEKEGHLVTDAGCAGTDSVDYPDFAKTVCRAVEDGTQQRGILVCGTGVGMSMVANRFPGIRAALCNDLFTARMSREHNDANVLCLGGRVVGDGLALEIVRTWTTTDFAAGRHQRRIDKF